MRWGCAQLQEAVLAYGHGTDNAWDEIVYLVLGALKLDSSLDPPNMAQRLTKKDRVQILRKIKQRVNERLPTAYLVNQAWFAGLPFYVDARVLIPRSPMAELIERQFRPWVDRSQQIGTILDLGTGSGCIAIACAYAFSEAQIDAVDCSEEALAVASINVARHKRGNQITLIQSNGLEGLKKRRYDIIISNPPYIDAETFARLPTEYRHEPVVALAAGADGLDMVVELLQQAKHYLKKGGLLIVEVGYSQSALLKRFPRIPFTWLEFERGEAEVFLLTREQLNY